MREPSGQACGGATGSTQPGRSPDRGKLIRKVLTAGVGGVLRTSKWHECETGFVVRGVRGWGSRRPGTHEVALDDQSEATTHDAIAVLAAERSL